MDTLLAYFLILIQLFESLSQYIVVLPQAVKATHFLNFILRWSTGLTSRLLILKSARFWVYEAKPFSLWKHLGFPLQSWVSAALRFLLYSTLHFEVFLQQLTSKAASLPCVLACPFFLPFCSICQPSWQFSSLSLPLPLWGAPPWTPIICIYCHPFCKLIVWFARGGRIMQAKSNKITLNCQGERGMSDAWLAVRTFCLSRCFTKVMLTTFWEL